MKVGIRKPNIKKSIKARTTGKLNRKIKSSINPLYGKSGMGVINNPKKALYNKVYNKTSKSLLSSWLPKSGDGFIGSVLKLVFLPAILVVWLIYIYITFITKIVKDKKNKQ